MVQTVSQSRVFEAFLASQLQDAQALSRESQVVQILPLREDDGPPRKYLARFDAPCLVRGRDGKILERRGFEVGFHFREEYLRHPASNVVQLLDPLGVYHPNVLGPMVCLGRLARSEGIVSLAHQLFEILTYQNFATHDGLNPDACMWARQPENRSRFPLDRRPLRRGPGVSHTLS